MKIVSMPYIGLIPFLPRRRIDERDEELCQCPISGLSHFYQKGEKNDHIYKYRVNALYRAYPISTVSFKKSAKINGFRTRF